MAQYDGETSNTHPSVKDEVLDSRRTPVSDDDFLAPHVSVRLHIRIPAAINGRWKPISRFYQHGSLNFLMAHVEWPEEVDTVIVGNGPSALILSYMLHGCVPYYDKSHPHPDPILHQRLRYSPCLLNINIDDLTSHFAASRISYSTQALPINVLLDTLLRPLADTDPGQYDSCVQWQYDERRCVKHVVLGNTANAGGQWADDPITGSGDIGALSYAEMLSLPGYKLMEFRKRKEETGDFFDRPLRRVVAEYLKKYPSMVGIDDSIYTNTRVEGISRSREGFYIKSHNLRCKHLVLASGTFSNVVPARSLLQPLLSLPNSPGLNDFPRLVVGSGFTAADVILSTPINRKVIHIFKWAPDDNPSPLRACHPSAYPEYASVYRRMKLAAKEKLSSDEVASPMRKRNDPCQNRMWEIHYEGLPNTCIKDVDVHGDTATITLEDSSGQIFDREISHMQYVIGRRGSLDYLDQDLLSEFLEHSESIQSTPIAGKTLRRKVEEDLEVTSNVFVIGSLTGDSLIRFAFGGCLYAAREIMQRNGKELTDRRITLSCDPSQYVHEDLRRAANMQVNGNGSSTIKEKASWDSETTEYDYSDVNGNTSPASDSDPQSPAKSTRRTTDAMKRSRRLSSCTIS